MGLLIKATDILFSMKTTIVLLLIFGAAVGTATFIENDFGRETAYALVYGSLWLEALMTLLTLNLIGNIFKYRMWQPKKIPLFVFHVAFVVIFIGAAITRYFGYEGMMHIREGQQQNQIFSRDPFLQVEAKKGDRTYRLERPLLLSVIGFNHFEEKLDIDGKPLVIKYKNFIKGVKTEVQEDPNGEPIISLRASAGMDSVDIVMKEGTIEDFGSFAFIFQDPDTFRKNLSGKDFVFFFLKDGKFYLLSNLPVNWMRMSDRSQGSIKAGEKHPLETGVLYSAGGINFVVKKAVEKGKEVVVPLPRSKELYRNSSVLSALYVDVEYDGQKKEAVLLGRGGSTPGIPTQLKIADLDLTMEWGAKVITLPFYIYLKDFVMRKYPGSNKPSSYESHVIVIDPRNNTKFEYNIHMNHPLVYGGYKFFQSSYDPDEKGTILSVNHDPGVIPTYIGYALLTIGLILNIFNPYSRFGRTLKMLNKNGLNKTVLLLLTLLTFSTGGFAYPGMQQDSQSQQSEQSATPKMPSMEEIIATVKKIDKNHAEIFATVAVQSADGRIKPFDTLAIDVVHKVHGSGSVLGLTHNQVLLGMFLMPGPWQYVKFIKVKHPAIKKILGIPMDAKYFAFIDAYDEKGMYKLAQAVETARRKDPAERSQFDKEVLKIDEKLYICYVAFTGDLIRIFPKENDPNNTWYPPREALKSFPEKQKEEVAAIMTKYIHGVQQGIQKGDWQAANLAVEDIKDFQRKYGYKVLPSETRLKAEILYNRLSIFERLTPFYFLIGFLSLGLIFAQIFKPSLNLEKASKVVVVLLFIAFLVHTFGLGLRWYVADHAPWTDAYESMLFISWAVALAGMVFARKSMFVLASVGIFAGIFLFAAHLGWLDPQITTIVPVLKSYWLLLHVSVLTASYGFLGLAAVLGLLILIFFVIKDERLLGKERVLRIELGIKEAMKIVDLSLIIGLSLIIIGNFLGAVWANESWGRYWGWDPKETWTAVSILVYAAIVHLKYIPQWYSYYKMAVFSVLGYFSILMTYFGVNYY
ncbi:MAG: cytochrome c biogenesis protein CcsA, partial [Aquificae bacterium]|nr:cytochrome c biogenesis protein CcsA [Aquificota bacterium]